MKKPGSTVSRRVFLRHALGVSSLLAVPWHGMPAWARGEAPDHTTGMGAVAELLEQERGLKWLFTGDSVTHAPLTDDGRRDYVQLFESRLRYFHTMRKRDFVIKTGISGWMIFNLANDLDWNVIQFQPHVVALNFGINDAVLIGRGTKTIEEWRATYLRVIERIRQESPAVVVVQTPTPIDLAASSEDVRRRTALPTLIEPLRDIARTADAILVDHWARWQPHVESGRFRDWMRDDIHPNARGHRLMARTVLETLGLYTPAQSETDVGLSLSMARTGG